MIKRAGLLLAVLAVVVVTTPASPVHLSYVYSDSMEPTISENDGFIVVPPDGLEVGDIVTFWSPQREEYATHRIVGETEEGFVTRGDNNEISDQAVGYSHVTREEIAGEALSLNGDPVTIPGVGIVVTTIAANRLLLIALGGTVLLASIVRSQREGTPASARSILRVRDVLYPLFVAAFIGSILFVVLGANHHSITYVATEGTGGSDTLDVGEPTNETYYVTAERNPFSTRVVSTSGMTVVNRSANASTVTLDVTIPPPETTGPYRTGVTLYRYPSVLPAGLIETLHGVHSVLAASVVSTIILAPLGALYVLLFDGLAPIRTTGRRTSRRKTNG